MSHILLGSALKFSVGVLLFLSEVILDHYRNWAMEEAMVLKADSTPAI